jgi:hypothetical protein
MGDLTDMMNAQMDNDKPAYPRSRTVPPSKTIPASKNSAPTPEQFNLATELVRVSEENTRLAVEVAKLTEERDQYRHDAGQRNQFAAEADRLEKERDGLAAVIAEARGTIPETNPELLDHGYGIDAGELLAVLTATPAATLAARDAEKKAEGWSEAVRYLNAHIGSQVVTDEALAQNPYRTPQQGEQG